MTPSRLLLLLLASLATALNAAVPDGYEGQPFADLYHRSGPATIPGIVQCALYDLGGEGVAYHDTTPSNEGSEGLNREPAHQRAHATPYIWHFRGREGVDLSYVKDWADLNHPNPVAPPLNMAYIGWASDNEWTNYTVRVTKAGTYRVRALYSHQANTIRLSINKSPAAVCRLPMATGDWHTWNYAEIGTVTFSEVGLQLLTLHYGAGNNFAFLCFEPL